LNQLLNELKRRNVFRVGVAYIVGAWLLAQVAELALDSFDAPGWVIKTILLLLALGLPISLFFAWAFELTPEGLKKEKDVDRSQSITQDTGRKLNTFIMSILVIAVGLLLADKFIFQLEQDAPAPAEASADTNSVAVLPFVDMSPDKDQEYFTDGLTENLLHALAQIRELKVAGRTSSFAFKGLNTDLREIGEQLNVSNILEGSVQKAGDRIRITTQLISAEDGYHLWSKTFDRDLDDIFVVQDEIAEAVASALRKSLVSDASPTTATTGDFEAYNAYLLGLSYLNKRTNEDWDRAIEQFQRAVEIDADMALAWAGLSNAYSAKTGFGTEFAEGFAKARAAAEKAIELDADLADGYLALARVQMSYDWDWSGADTSLRRANALRPGDPDIFVELATLSRIRGDSVGAFDGIEQALEQDPLNTALVRIHIGMLVSLGRIEEALEKAVFLARATPERGGVHASLAGIHRRSGNLDQALEAAEKESFLFLRLQHEAIIYHEMGEQDTAQEKLQELIDTFGDDVSWQVATVYANWGDKDETVAAIERGIAVRDPGVIYIQMNTRIVDLLQDDPRYDELLKKINLR
jgi:TolB-like protein/NOL1/NOP2/fmu family ribosome biogenesis protein